MKKTLCLLLALLMLLGTVTVLVSCKKDLPDTTETDTVGASESVTETETEPETLPPLDGTIDPTDPRFSRYAADGNYYAFLEIFEKNKYSVSFDIEARKMSIADPNGKVTVYSYDKDYFLKRIDTPSSVVITIDNTVSKEGLLLLQAVRYHSSSGDREYSLAYTYDEDDRISGMKLVDDYKDETINSEFVYCGKGSYLIRSLDNDKMKYYHLNYFLTSDPVTSISSKVLRNGDREVVFTMGPLVDQKMTLTRTSGEACKMFNEYCLFNAMLNKLKF